MPAEEHKKGKKGRKSTALADEGAIQFVKTPFNPDNNTDVILRSSDGEDFHTSKALLSFASPVFETMFTLPAAANATPDSIPVVDLTTNKDTIYQLLQWCDPRCIPSWNLEDILKVLDVADMYDMKGVAEHASKILCLFANKEPDPVRLYAIAIRYGITSLATVAAKETLRVPLEGRSDIPELDNISGTAVQRLQTYHFTCGNVAKSVAKDFSWISAGYVWETQIFGCSCVFVNQNGRWWARWWMDTMSVIAEDLYRRPRGTTITGNTSLLSSDGACGRCKDRASNELRVFGQLFASEVEKRISNVSVLHQVLRSRLTGTDMS